VQCQPTQFLLVPLSLLALSGCAHVPAFRASLPDSIDPGDTAIAVIGDLQQTSALVRMARRREDNALAQQILIADLKRQIDTLAGLIIVGDLVYTARSARHWNHFDSLVTPFAQRMPVLPAIGNHDYPCYLVQFCSTAKMAKGMRTRFPWMRPGQPYTVDAGRLLLLFIDSESHLEAQGRWLDEQLSAATDQYAAALVFFHRPAFSNSIDRGATGDADVQRFLVPALSASQLPVVALSGHVHGYEHIVYDGVNYVTTAGGGGPRGPMPAGSRTDAYRGPECARESDGAVVRPFNYVLVRSSRANLLLEMHGFCQGDTDVRLLDTIEVELNQ
jgi:hypothetical protein